MTRGPSPFDKPKENLPPPKKVTLSLRRGDTHGVFEFTAPLPPAFQVTLEDRERLVTMLEEGFQALPISAGLKDGIKAPLQVAE